MDFFARLAGGLPEQQGLFLKSLPAALLILFLGLALRRPLLRLCLRLLEKLAARAKGGMLPLFVRACEKPARALLLVFILFLSLSALRLPGEGGALFAAFCIRVLRIGFILCACWALGAFISPQAVEAGLFGRSGEKLGETFCRFSSRILHMLIAAFGVVFLLSELGFDPSGLITGLGLGGLTLALAAQDWASNLFGGLVILFDRPFAVGDWIQVEETLEGVVEDVSFRSTRIRTFDNAQVAAPNSLLVSKPIVNWSRMEKRKISFDLRLSYDSPPERLAACTQQLRELLAKMPEISEEPQVAVVYGLGESGVEIRIHCFSRLTGFADYMRLRERLNLQVLEAVSALGLRIALPARALYIEGDSPTREKAGPGQKEA